MWPALQILAELVPGTLITPSVRLVRHLGAGGMGSVWVADHLTLHTQVVVKFMAQDLAKDAASVARFSREAAAASQVKSPHVVQTFDHGISDGLPFIVMELLEGEDLGKRLERSQQMSMDDVSMIVAQVAKALTRAHERGVVHRDIKPENIFLCDAGGGELFVKVLDFGIAKRTIGHVSGDTATGQMMGTPVYMSPEQLNASKIDHRVDLWSLGIVAYEALTGQRPFGGDTIAALAVAIHSRDYAKPSTLNSALSPAVDEWFQRACAKDPEQRFASARELSDALRVAGGAKPEENATLSTDRFVVRGSAPAGEADVLRAMQTTLAVAAETPSSTRRGWLWPVLGLGAAVLVVSGLALVGLVGTKPAPAVNGAPPSASQTSVTQTSSSQTSGAVDIASATSASAVPAASLSAAKAPVPSSHAKKHAPATAVKSAPATSGSSKPKPNYDIE